MPRPATRCWTPPTRDPLLSIYAVRRASGAVNLLAINKDPTNTITHQITLTGLVPNGTATIRSYGIPQDEATRTNAPAAAQDIATGTFTGVAPSFSYSFPPYSITLFTFEPPGEPWLTVARVSPNSVTVSWPNMGSYTLQTNGNLTATGLECLRRNRDDEQQHQQRHHHATDGQSVLPIGQALRNKYRVKSAAADFHWRASIPAFL